MKARFSRSLDVVGIVGWGALLVLVLVSAWGGPSLAGAGRTAPAPTVILISLDGTQPREVGPETLPSLDALARRGAMAERLIPAMPANTFPNHVTLVTGVSPERHGMVNNVFLDAEKGIFRKKDIPEWIEVEPLWSLLEGEGIVSAAYYWVGSEGPWRSGRGARHWLPFSSRTGEKKKVEQILAWLDLPEGEGRPHFISSWFHGADHAAHRHGPASAEAGSALREQDPAIASLIAGLETRGLFDSTTLIFVSDHGMAPAVRRVDLGAELKEAGFRARVFGIGGFASVDVAAVDQRDPALLSRLVASVRALGLDAIRREDAPASLGVRHPRFGDVVVRAPVGTAIVYRGLHLEGFHGYDPEHPSMSALFVAAGRGVVAGTTLPAVHAVDVAPTVLALLGVSVPEWMEGRPILAVVPIAASSATIPGPERGK